MRNNLRCVAFGVYNGNSKDFSPCRSGAHCEQVSKGSRVPNVNVLSASKAIPVTNIQKSQLLDIFICQRGSVRRAVKTRGRIHKRFRN
jgi:hypothetical protein